MKVKISLAIIALTMMYGVFAQKSAVIDSLENILKTAKQDTAKVIVLNSLSKQYKNISDFEKAMQYAESALALAEKLNYKRGKADVYNSIGKRYLSIGNFQEAMKNFFAALKISEEIGYKKGVAHSYNNIGTYYQCVGNFTEALENYLYALNIWEDIGHKNGIAGSYNNIGIMYGSQGNYSKALKNFFACLKIREEIRGKNGDAGSYSNIGIIYALQGNYPKALENYFYSLNIWEDIGYKIGIAECYNNIGFVYYRQGNYPEARKYLNDGLALQLKIGNKLGIKFSYESLATLDSVEGNFAQALENYKMYTLYKDSILNEESNNQIARLKIQFETEKKDQKIVLLKKDNVLQVQQLEKQKLLRNGMIAGTALLLLVGLLLFRSFRLHKKLEKQQAITQERNRISADLHDDMGSNLSEIFLLSDVVIRETKATQAKDAAMKIANNSRHLLKGMGEIIWVLNSNNDYLESMVAYIRRYAAEYFESSTVKLKINTPVKLPKTQISAEHRRNIFYTVKEALHNIVKHAQATDAEMKIMLGKKVLSIIIKDNGRGIPKGVLNRFGNGMNNMQSRMTSIKGEFSVQNYKGTKVTLKLPVG
jgi:signal transduction histidine kinase/Flp pilus assembly protein TadD